MDTLLRLLQDIPSQIGMLAAALLVFILGGGVGFLVSWLLGRKTEKEFREAALFIKAELGYLDTAVGNVWSKTLPSHRHRVSANTIPVNEVNKKTSAIADLYNARLMLQSLTANISSIERTVAPKSGKEPGVGSGGYASTPQGDGVDENGNGSKDASEEFDNQEQGQDPEVETKTYPSLPEKTPDAMVHLYNRAVNDTSDRERFREHYCPIRIGTVNAVERRQNPTIAAEIKETTDGNFFALPIPGTNEFAVFPRFGLTIEAVSYGAGAIGEVFDKTKRHDPKLFYSNYTVKHPAIFRLEGGHWNLSKPGELDLGVGE